MSDDRKRVEVSNVPASMLAEWRDAARAAGLSLAAWARVELTKAARLALRKEGA